ncbi:MAG: nuclear transport factor 2 family protein [Hyphomicrobiaceae bacterium]
MADAVAKSDVLKANDAFYDAVRAGDFVRLDDLLSRQRKISVVHPGWAGLSGREDVLASWVEIFVAGNAPDVWPIDEQVIMSRNSALVYCTEIVGENRLSATNVFVREGDAWRMTQHMAFG